MQTTQKQFIPPGTKIPAYAITFQSLTEIADWTAARHADGTHIPCGWSRRECPTTAKAERRIHTGDNAMVAASEKLMTMIEATSPEGVGQIGVVRAVAGGFPDVPALLAGSPLAMRQRRRRHALASLRIVVNVASSAGISDSLLERRGAATLALLRLLETAGHPVELWVMHGIAGDAQRCKGGAFTFVRMETGPVDLARSAWALGSSEFSRHVLYNANTTHLNDPGLSPWPWQSRRWHENQKLQAEAVACAMDIEESEMIYLPMVYLSSGSAFENDKTSAAWVTDTYTKATAAYVAE